MSRRLLALLHRAAAFVQRGRLDREFEEEVRAHLELSAAEYRARGLSSDEARRAAILALGGVERTRDLHRDTRGLPGLEILLQDVRYAIRNMRRTPGFTLTAVLILTLGIGASALVFSVIQAVLLRPLPFAAPEQLVWIANDYEGSAAAGLSGVSSRFTTFEEWQRRTTSWSGLTAYNAFFGFDSYKLSAAGEPERLGGVGVARGFFEVLGVRMHMGRTFTEAEASPNGPRAALVSYALWRQRFASDPAVIGRQITLNDRPATIVGVLPEALDFGAVFAPGVRVDIVEPLVPEVARQWGNTLAVIGRLKPGVTLEAAQAEIASVMPRILADHPGTGQHGGRLVPLASHVRGAVRQPLFALAGAVAMVLLIVCANLSNLMLSRAASRQREFAIRSALGAGRGRLVRQMLTESLVLAGAGALAGVALAALAADALASTRSVAVPLLSHVRLDGAAAAFTACAAVLSAALAGLLPALQVAAGGTQTAMKDAARGTTSAREGRWRDGLIVLEVALACVLLVGAGLLLRSFDRLTSVPLGFEATGAVALRIEPNQTTTDVGQRRQFVAEVLRRSAALPGVSAVGVTDTLPLDRDRAWGIRVPGRTFSDAEAPVAHVRMVTHGYFEAMGIRIRAGRDFTEPEALQAMNILLVNDTMARTLWPGRDAVGQEVLIGDAPVRIIGIVDDVRHSALEKGAGMEMYLPLARSAIRGADLVVRAERPPEQLAADLRTALRPLDPGMPLGDVRPLQSLVDRAVSPRRFYTGLIASFAAAALLLACLGIFGVISYGVSRRTTEIGIRLALGARPSTVRLAVVLDTLRIAAIGLVAGVAASWVLTRSLSSLLYDVTSTDPVTFAVAAAAILAVSLLAGYLPARRASRVDPLVALRAE